MDLRYLITGTGRCGTVYLAKVLTSVGIPCGHESIFDWQGWEMAQQKLAGKLPPSISECSLTEWNLANGQRELCERWVPDTLVAESSYMAAPFLTQEPVRDVPLIHLVRHPVRVVNSFCNFIDYFESPQPNNHYERFIYDHLPELMQPLPPYDRACLFYCLWNEMIEIAYGSRLLFVWRAEDPNDGLLRLLGKDGRCFNNRKSNSYQKSAERFTVSKIQDPEIRKRFEAKGEKYGYNMAEDILIL
jgi:hypothetical protein